MVTTYRLSKSFSRRDFRGRGNPIKFSAVKPEVKIEACKIGDYSLQIAKELGYSDDAIKELVEGGVLFVQEP